MKCPKRVKVGHRLFKIEFDQKIAEVGRGLGFTASDNDFILLAEVQGKSALRDTVLHELLHAIWCQTPIIQDYPDDGEDSAGEKIISAITPYLVSVLRDNPDLVAFLLQEDRIDE